MITAKDIKDAFESSEFKSELEDLSSYAANIRQERPVVLLFAKYFWRRGYKLALEKKKCDLVIDETRVEFKFHFDSDSLSLQKELRRYDGNIELLMNAVSKKEISPTWTVSPGIYKDVMMKRPDIFVWVLCARDLSKLTNDDIDRICIGAQQQCYNRGRPFESNQEFLEVADNFLAKLQELRKFSLEKAVINTNGGFPSAYYLRACDFAADKGA
jgi:hypothetical protein